MSKNTVRKLAFVLAFALMTGSAGRAFASSAEQTSIPSPTSTSSSSSTSDGITGTDPEPIDPGIISIVLAVLGLT